MWKSRRNRTQWQKFTFFEFWQYGWYWRFGNGNKNLHQYLGRKIHCYYSKLFCKQYWIKSRWHSSEICWSVFLVKESDKASQTVKLNDVPAADYVSLTYTVGVDSAKSVADVSKRTGVLDPASYGTDNMYWSWNSGYIFFKMEGNSDNITAANKNTSSTLVDLAECRPQQPIIWRKSPLI